MDKRLDEIIARIPFKDLPVHLTERLILCEISAENYKSILTSKDEDLTREFLQIADDSRWEFEKRKLDNGLVSWAFSLLFFQMLDKSTGFPIGQIGFHTINLRHAKAEVGYALYDQANSGKGLMQEAAAFVFQYGFEVLNLIRIEAMASPSNEASKKILLNAGFEEEGLLKSNYLRDGNAEDSIMFGLLRESWAKKTPNPK
jgi:[ribosomal protein S5]-alanine N-acetyltransferase